MPDIAALALLWLQLLVCLAAIGTAGRWLSRCGAAVGEHTGMSGSWVGFTLLAAVTTLPELVTTVSALRLAGAPDIAVGGLLGSVAFNLLILCVLEVIASRRTALYAALARTHLRTAGLGAGLLGLVGVSLLVEHAAEVPALAHVGAYTPVILLLWLWAMRRLFVEERQAPADAVADGAARCAGTQGPAMSLRRALAGYAGSAAVVVGAGLWLPFVAKTLALAHGWEQSFVGTLLVAVVTSAPELSVTLASARLGALDMAVGNVLGANLLNLAMLGVGDLIYTGAPLLRDASQAHVATAFSALLMTLLFMAGLAARSRPRVFGRLSVVGLMLAQVYLLNAVFLFTGTRP
jgi:cation:H+ antiporter